MKRATSNLLTIVLALLVLAAGAAYAMYLLPVMTDDRETETRTFSIAVNAPEEIIQAPEDPVDCAKVFPKSFSQRSLFEEAAPDDPRLQERKAFLALLETQANVLFSVRLDSTILERYTQIWQFNSASNPSDVSRTDDLYFLDVLFLDARSVLWRVTACGYSDQVFYLSCLVDGAQPSSPAFPTDITYPRTVTPSQELDRASTSFWTRLLSFHPLTLFSGENDYYLAQTTVEDRHTPDVYWKIHLESDGNYLLSAYSREDCTPICYSFINIQRELQQTYDPLWNTY